MRTTTVLALALAALTAASACRSHHARSLAPTDPLLVEQTLADLAAFGPKHAGTASNDSAAAYVLSRFETAGLTGVHLEAFQFPRQIVSTSAIAVTIDGVPLSVAADVLEATGSGDITAPVTDVKFATDGDLAGLDLTGQIAMVHRTSNPHRSTQFANVLAKGALGMLYASAAPNNLRQVGTVRRSWESFRPAPAMTIGSADSVTISTAAIGGHAVVATLHVVATSVPAGGHNVVGTFPGSDPAAGTIVIGAHYDTWFAGSFDNGGGVAALIALAERLGERGQPRATLVFVAYDGEEIGLYGSYAWMRAHVIDAGEPVKMVLNFEVPSSTDASFLALAHSPTPGVDQSLVEAGLKHLYPNYADMQVVPLVFGGIIPTDVQGFYRGHVPSATTAADSSYYHTTEDTPDKVDDTFLAAAVDAFDLAVRFAGDRPAADFAAIDQALWNAAVTVTPGITGQPLSASVIVTDAGGIPQASAPIAASLLYDDFFLAGEITGTTDSNGAATFTFPASQADMGTGSRWLHVTSGPSWPLVEQLSHAR